MRKLCKIFLLPSSLHTVSHYLPLSEFCGPISENIFFILELIVQKLFFDKNYWFQPLSTKNDWIISLFLMSVTLHSLSLNHSLMVCVGEETSFGFRWKLYATPHQVTLREKILFLRLLSVVLSVFFVFFFWPVETTAANLQRLTIVIRNG